MFTRLLMPRGLCCGFVVACATILGVALAPQALAQTISGIAFRDYDADGVRDTGSITATGLDDEYGVADLHVSAYIEGTLTPAATATTCGASVACGGDPVGSYTLSGLSTSVVYRLELTGLPDFLESGAAGSSRVVFASGGDTGVDFGVANPAQYCSANPDMVTNCYSNGDPLAGGDSGTDPWIVQFPNNPATDSGANVYLANGTVVGATWGLAYHRKTGKVFAGALIKRHSGLGTQGTGGIYTIDVATQTAAPFANLAADYGADTGSLAGRSLPADRNDPNRDSLAFDAVGKMGLGDLDLSDDGKTLYVMNVKTNTVYELGIGDSGTKPGSATTHALPTPSCSSGAFRAFALNFHDGMLYAGGVCTGENGGGASDLRAYVYRHDPSGSAGNFALVFDMPLDYPRGYATNSSSDNGDIDIDAEWQPWIDTWADYEALNQPQPYGKQVIYPQPMLSDIEFDVDGALLLGIMDRWGHQSGNANYSTDFDDTDTYEGTAAGDLVRACPNGSGGFTLESNASCGGITTGGASSSPAQGNGGGEYYWQDMYRLSTDKNDGGHNEIILGGLSLLEGSGTVGTTVFDPLTDFRAGGTGWFDNTLGTRPYSYEVFALDAGAGPDDSTPGTFGKAAGLGDLEAICPITPLEIGNRAWCDANGDGVQDGSEAGINGLEVVLLCDTGGGTFSEVGRATTANDARGYAGSYLFTDASVGGSGIPRNASCRLVIDPSQAAIETTCGTNAYAPTKPNNGGSGHSADLRDSDGEFGVGGDTNVGVEFTTGDDGENNFTYDFGFTFARDYGDAPDSYGTNGGANDSGNNEGESASHLVSTDVRLGACVDGERDGEPQAAADGDNNKPAETAQQGTCGASDEDGVDFGVGGPAAPACSTQLFTLTVLNDRFFGAYVHAWIDYDADGVFDPVTEKAFTTSAISQSSSPQQIQVSASIPCDAAFGESYMRFRLDDNENGVLPTGARGIGEVEDYRYGIIGDFGDLPQDLVGSSDYPTEQASSGASHVILDSCFLGSTVDGEVDGQADLSADGDGADEDGIEFTTAPFVKNTSETISVLGFDDTGCANALLYCWADFNGDGTLNNAEEFIINGGDPADVAFTFITPATLSTSQVYVRCRYSTDPAAASPTGRASNGEVEDYLVTGALPVELSAFELSRADMQVELSWQTLTETDNAGFSIEHRLASCSSDCAWSELSFVQGAGTTETPQAYAYRTAPLEPGVHQFRLKQVDFDGQHSYSAVLEQRLDVPSAAYLEPAYPNPFNPSTQIRFTMEDRGEVYVGLYDLTGRHVKTLFEGDVEAGQSQTLRVDASGLPSGTYVIRLEGAKAQSTQQITLIK